MNEKETNKPLPEVPEEVIATIQNYSGGGQEFPARSNVGLKNVQVRLRIAKEQYRQEEC